MGLKRNILASYLSQIYVTLAGIVVLPLYLRYMGVEAYGLVGFFAMLQTWFNLLDMGLSPTMTRQTARCQGGTTDALNVRHLLRALEGIFICVAFPVAVAIIAGADFVAAKWLNARDLPLNEVRNAVMLMGLIAALRWLSSLYRGVVTGFERLVWLSSWNALVATLRFVLIIPFFIFWGASPTDFFSYQLGVALLELGVLAAQTYRLLPKPEAGQHTRWQWQPLREVLKFSSSVAFASIVWVLVTQTDKLVLSKLLSLTDYGYFSIAVLAAGGVLMVSGPVSSSIMPRLSRLQAEDNSAGVIHLYRSATQLVAMLAVPATLVLAFFSEQVLWAWTGNPAVVSVAPLLTLYAIGYGILALGAFPYYLQYAKGNLRLHLMGNLLLVLLLVPSLVWATWRFGMLGAGWVWLTLNVVYFMLWVPVVHQRYAPGLHWPWLVRDIIFTGLPTVLAAWLMHYISTWPGARGATAIQLCILGVMLVGVSGLSSSKTRAILARRLGYRTDN